MVEGMNSNIMYLIYCKNFCKCHNVSLPNTTIKERRKEGKKEEGRKEEERERKKKERNNEREKKVDLFRLIYNHSSCLGLMCKTNDNAELS
jgi:hypothetical protein